MLNLCIYCICIQLPREMQLKLELFFTKTILIKTNTSSRSVLTVLNPSKFLEILNSDKTPNKFSTNQLKVTFKIYSNVCTPWVLNIQTSKFFHLFYTISIQAIYINEKLHISSHIASLTAVSKLSTFFMHPVELCRLELCSW